MGIEIRLKNNHNSFFEEVIRLKELKLKIIRETGVNIEVGNTLYVTDNIVLSGEGEVELFPTTKYLVNIKAETVVEKQWEVTIKKGINLIGELSCFNRADRDQFMIVYNECRWWDEEEWLVKSIIE